MKQEVLLKKTLAVKGQRQEAGKRWGRSQSWKQARKSHRAIEAWLWIQTAVHRECLASVSREKGQILPEWMLPASCLPRDQCMISHLISAHSLMGSVHYQALDQCMISHVISA